MPTHALHITPRITDARARPTTLRRAWKRGGNGVALDLPLTCKSYTASVCGVQFLQFLTQGPAMSAECLAAKPASLAAGRRRERVELPRGPRRGAADGGSSQCWSWSCKPTETEHFLIFQTLFDLGVFVMAGVRAGLLRYRGLSHTLAIARVIPRAALSSRAAVLLGKLRSTL